MALTRVWSRGQVTIPARFRRELHLEENTPIKVVRIGRSLILARQGMVDSVSKKFEREVKKNAISFDDLLKDLKKTRKEINRQKYGV
jgi:AbrB family looped-hinge helix DNA binding protein